jgi:hypothetical protein
MWGSIEEDWDLKGTSTIDRADDIGSMDEKIWNEGSLNHNRAFNHFLGSGNKPLTFPLVDEIAGFQPNDAYNWGYSDERNNVNYYDYALAAAKTGNRKDAWLYLGHFLHLLQDMTVPSHTRNDAHPGFKDIYNYDSHEKYTGNASFSTLYTLLENLQPQLPKSSEIEDLFDNLSDHTRSNYFSKF